MPPQKTNNNFRSPPQQCWCQRQRQRQRQCQCQCQCHWICDLQCCLFCLLFPVQVFMSCFGLGAVIALRRRIGGCCKKYFKTNESMHVGNYVERWVDLVRYQDAHIGCYVWYNQKAKLEMQSLSFFLSVYSPNQTTPRSHVPEIECASYLEVYISTLRIDTKKKRVCVCTLENFGFTRPMCRCRCTGRRMHSIPFHSIRSCPTTC